MFLKQLNNIRKGKAGIRESHRPVRRPDGEKSTSKVLEGGGMFIHKFSFWELKREESTVESRLAERSIKVHVPYVFPNRVFVLARVDKMGATFRS